MIKDGQAVGNIFYIAAYLGDCAKDHVEYQGKIYVDEKWEINVPKSRYDEVANYIAANDIKTIQSVTEGPAWFTTRPNCRHYFQMIAIDEVLGIKTENELNSKREEYGLNFNGKYKPAKYKALAEQRYNERNIRHWKGKLEADQKLLDKMPSTIPECERLLLSSRIALDKRKIRAWQARQRDLIKANPNVLERNYDREAYNRMRSDFGVRKELKRTPIEQVFRKEKRNLDLEEAITTFVGKENIIPKLLTEKYGVSKNSKIILRNASNERLGSIEDILSDHSNEINKNYTLYISKIKECIINPIDVKKADNNKFYLYAFYGISKRKRKGINNPYLFMQTIIQKEKDSNYYTVVSAFPNIK